MYFIPFQLVSILMPDFRLLYFIEFFFNAVPLKILSRVLFDCSVVCSLCVYLYSDPDLFSKCSLSPRHCVRYTHMHAQTHDGTIAVNRRFGRCPEAGGVADLCS